MAYPAPSSFSHSSSHSVGSPVRATTLTPRCSQHVLTQTEGDHQLEKLEFALAVALTRGDQHRSAQLRDQIAALGGNQEEPGT
jgi:protein-arginine kinase activator protein McsA